MTHEDYMKMAIRAAKKSEKHGGCAIGAVIVKNGEVISEGLSLVATTNDPTYHAESDAIRKASQKLNSFNLEGCELYSTLESCSMCFSAALWSNMKSIYFGSYASDNPSNDFGYESYSLEKFAADSHLWDGSKMTIVGGVLRDECKELMKDYKNWSKVS